MKARAIDHEIIRCLAHPPRRKDAVRDWRRVLKFAECRFKVHGKSFKFAECGVEVYGMSI